MRQVVITGIGLLTPFGYGVPLNWENITKGASGIGKITYFDTTDYSVKIAGEIPKNPEIFNPDSVLSQKEQRHVDKFILYGMASSKEAMEDSGYIPTGSDQDRYGVLIASGIGGVGTIAQAGVDILQKGPRVSPFLIPSVLINLLGGHISIRYGLKGPNLSVATACAAGGHAIMEAALLIQNDEVDSMLVCGAESPICPVGVAGFGQARALSTKYNDTPSKASRPWDRDRDGFVMGEGSGSLVLEEYEHAKKRGAKIYGFLAGYGASADAHHITAPKGIGGLTAMQKALKKANLSPLDIDYINAHGTSTILGDKLELDSIHTLFKENTKLSISSTKSMIGHLFGAAGTVEAIFSLLAMKYNIIPPTINLDNIDDSLKEYRLDLTPNIAKEKEVKIALSNSFCFGGTNATLIFKKGENA